VATSHSTPADALGNLQELTLDLYRTQASGVVTVPVEMPCSSKRAAQVCDTAGLRIQAESKILGIGREMYMAENASTKQWNPNSPISRSLLTFREPIHAC
jgi:hypothetical protein